jgi:hypothetical protein
MSIHDGTTMPDVVIGVDIAESRADGKEDFHHHSIYFDNEAQSKLAKLIAKQLNIPVVTAVQQVNFDKEIIDLYDQLDAEMFGIKPSTHKLDGLTLDHYIVLKKSIYHRIIGKIEILKQMKEKANVGPAKENN